jgi:hypothetical protein
LFIFEPLRSSLESMVPVRPWACARVGR